jgi:hypothetical protein
MYKWIALIAAMALFIGLQMTAARAQDAATTAPAGKATVSVTVLDSDSNPVAGAKVTLMPPRAKKKKAAADAGAADPTPAPARRRKSFVSRHRRWQISGSGSQQDRWQWQSYRHDR